MHGSYLSIWVYIVNELLTWNSELVSEVEGLSLQWRKGILTCFFCTVTVLLDLRFKVEDLSFVKWLDLLHDQVLPQSEFHLRLVTIILEPFVNNHSLNPKPLVTNRLPKSGYRVVPKSKRNPESDATRN